MPVIQITRRKKYAQPVPPLVRRAPEPAPAALSSTTKALLVALAVARTMGNR